MTPAGDSNGTGEGAPDRQLDRDAVPHDVNPMEFPVKVGSQLAHEHHHELSCSPQPLFWPAFSLTLHFAGSAPTSERLRLLRTTPAAHCGMVISSMTWPSWSL
jgi:hypothetical protein